MPDSNDWRSLYPFESHYLSVDGHRLHYLDEGRGPTLLLVHGNPTWSFYWRNLITALSDRYRLIVPDHIGCGLSDKPDASSYSYRLQDRIDNLSALIEHLDLRDITLVAHDWGGGIGMGAAVAAAERFGRFVLMNTAAFPGGKCPWRIRVCRIPYLGQLGVQGLNLFALAALRMAVARRERMTPAVRAGLLAPYDSWRNRLAVHRFVMDIPLSDRHPSHATMARMEAGLSQFRDDQFLFPWGMRDWCFTPKFLDRFLELFPEAETHRFQDDGHYIVEDAHERIAPLIEQFVGGGD